MLNRQYLIKAFYAGAITFLGGWLAVLQAPGAEGVAQASWVAIGLATLVSVGGVLGLQAAPKTVATGIKSD